MTARLDYAEATPRGIKALGSVYHFGKSNLPAAAGDARLYQGMRRALQFASGAALLAVALPQAAAPQSVKVREAVKPLLHAPLPNLPGKALISIEVDFPPGAASVPHTHPPSAFVYAYVLSGDIISALGTDKPRLYHAGESWTEAPGAFHRVTRNASASRPARLLVIFVGDAAQTDLVRPIERDKTR